jgi:drug/metabolite transporter (DMT)-like permease
LSALLGYLYYDEQLTALDWVGAMLIVAALILVRLRASPQLASEAL